jgi:hypothetical protein
MTGLGRTIGVRADRLTVNPEPLRVESIPICRGCGKRAPWCSCGAMDYAPSAGVDPAGDDLDRLLRRLDMPGRRTPHDLKVLCEDAAAALRAARTERDAALAMCAVYAECIAAHDAVEHLIADHTDDRDVYNQAVKRANEARRAVADAIAQATRNDRP